MADQTGAVDLEARLRGWLRTSSRSLLSVKRDDVRAIIAALERIPELERALKAWHSYEDDLKRVEAERDAFQTRAERVEVAIQEALDALGTGQADRERTIAILRAALAPAPEGSDG